MTSLGQTPLRQRCYTSLSLGVNTIWLPVRFSQVYVTMKMTCLSALTHFTMIAHIAKIREVGQFTIDKFLPLSLHLEVHFLLRNSGQNHT